MGLVEEKSGNAKPNILVYHHPNAAGARLILQCSSRLNFLEPATTIKKQEQAKKKQEQAKKKQEQAKKKNKKIGTQF
jgi:prophage tail gpP-like protein